MAEKSAVLCLAGECRQILAERIGALWLIKAHGRDVVAVGVLTMRCPRCHKAWRNDELALFDDVLLALSGPSGRASGTGQVVVPSSNVA